MQVRVEKATYRRLLDSSLEQITFDPTSGESFSFEELFYPLEIEEGKYAFQSYAEQMDRARTPSPFRFYGDRTNKARSEELSKKISDLLSQTSPSASDGERDSQGSPEAEPEPQYALGDNDSDSNEAVLKALSRQILGTIKAYQENQGDSQKLQTSVDAKEFKAKTETSNGVLTAQEQSLKEEEADEKSALTIEDLYAHNSLIIKENAQASRILAIASAGHGKTTLLRRIALYYCHPFSDGERHREIRTKYSLSGDFVPCLLRLRDITDQDYSVEKVIEKSVTSVFRSAQTGNDANESLETQVRAWVNSIRDELLLLIDGLDELSDSRRYKFLSALDNYLRSNPQSRVIMTSRVAGLSDPKVQAILNRMGFRGRSIIPLTDENARRYSEKWIDVTQPDEQKAQLKFAIEQILHQSKFDYLKDFMRTPLELLMILRQISNDSFSLNRFQMFRDILWEYFTNHVQRYDQKRPVFEDTMTLLGFIAYQMQLNDSMLISTDELDKMSHALSHLSFHTDLIKRGTLEDYREVLDSLAANVGIIERDDRTSDVVYTFPIRAYQEYLTAHACCHLRLNTELSKPDPYGIFQQHLSDSRWISIINFALSDLGTNNQQEFDAVINLVFRQAESTDQLRAVVEADLAITKDHALLLCENVFSKQVLTNKQRELLIACMNTKSAYAYAYALKTAYQADSGEHHYLEAAALSTVLREYDARRSALEKAASCLRSGISSQMTLGAEMVSLLTRTLMDEISDAYKNRVESDFRVTDELLAALAGNAQLQNDVISVIALTNIWLSKAAGSGKAKRLLDVRLASLVIAELNRNRLMVRELCLIGKEMVNSPEYLQIRELIYALGSFPATSGIRKLLDHDQQDLFISSLLEAMYQETKDDFDVDQVAIATACLYYCWDINRFMEAWISEICRGMPSEYVRKDMSGVRERNHFSLVRKSLAKTERAFRAFYEADLNRIEAPTSVFSLFRAGDVRGAADFCIRTLGTAPSSNRTNLAFLLRYGKLKPEDLESRATYSIPDLLADGVQIKEHYALINMALYEFEQRHFSNAREILEQLTEEDWRSISEQFWYPELWRTKKDPEGALVCVLASAYGRCDFKDYEEMLEVVNQHYSESVTEVLRPDNAI